MKRVLLIEDDVSLLNLYRRVLSSKDCEVESATDGESGIEKLESFKPDIIFLDYVLPNMNGDSVLKIIRETPGFKSTPVIILTGSTDKMEETFEIGATAYLHKGTNITKKLLDCIKIYT